MERSPPPTRNAEPCPLLSFLLALVFLLHSGPIPAAGMLLKSPHPSCNISVVRCQLAPYFKENHLKVPQIRSKRTPPWRDIAMYSTQQQRDLREQGQQAARLLVTARIPPKHFKVSAEAHLLPLPLPWLTPLCPPPHSPNEVFHVRRSDGCTCTTLPYST